MASQPLPKTNLFGNYPKKSMNAYIFEINEKSQEEQQRVQEKLEDVNRQKDELQSQVDALQSEVASLEAKCREHEQRAAHFNDDLVAKESDLFAAKQKNSELQEIIDRQKAEIAERNELLAAKDAEIEQLMLEQAREPLPPKPAAQPVPAETGPPQPPANSAPTAELERERQELDGQRRELEEKRRELDEKRREIEVAAQQISRIFTSAQADAEALLENARRQANAITENAQLKSRAMLEQAQRSADLAVGGVFQKFESFKNEFALVQKSVEEAVLGMNTSLSSINTAIGGVRTDLPIAEVLPTPVAPAPHLSGEAPSALTSQILNQYGLGPDRKEFFR